MNYIKKKIKGHHHKKGHDEDEDFDLEPASAPPHPGSAGVSEDTYVTVTSPPKPFAPDRASERAAENKNSEEWQFFQQLTQRVQDTVQKTQTTLSKFKDSSAVDDITKQEHELNEEAEIRAQQVAASWVNFEDGSGRVKGEENVATPKKPGRPPPPRPPPPPANNLSPIQVEELPSGNLLEEFGFQSEPLQVLPNGNVSNLLFPEEEEGDDPFDTSFVTRTVALAPKSPTSHPAKSSGIYEDLLGTSAAEDYLRFDTNTPISTNSQNNLLPTVLSTTSNSDILSLQTVVGSLNPTQLYEEEENTSDQPDPFDTTFVDALTEKNSPVFEKLQSPPTTASGPDEEMSNPFLTDNSGLLDLCSTASTPPARPPPPEIGYARPRKMSTNPFEMTDLLEDFILEGNYGATGSTQPTPPGNAFDSASNITQDIPSTMSKDTSPFGQEMPLSFGQETIQATKVVPTAIGQVSSPYRQEVPIAFEQNASAFGQDTLFGQDTSFFGDEVSTTFGKENTPFDQDVSSAFGQESILFAQEVPKSFEPHSSPFGQEDSTGFDHQSPPFGHKLNKTFPQDSTVFGQEVEEVHKQSLPFSLNAQTTNLSHDASSDLFDPFASKADFPSVPLTSDDPFLVEAEDTFPPEDLLSGPPKIDPAVRNVISTLEKIASFAAADDIGPPEHPASSTLFPDDHSKDDGTGDSTPHAMDFASELEDAKEDKTSEESPINVFQESGDAWPANPFGDDPASSVPKDQPHMEQVFAESFLFGGKPDEPLNVLDLTGDPFGGAKTVMQDKSPFAKVSGDFFGGSGEPENDPFGEANSRKDSLDSENVEKEHFESVIAKEGFFNTSNMTGLDAFSTTNTQDDPFGSAATQGPDPFGSSADSMFNMSSDNRENDLFGAATNDPFGALKDNDPFGTSSLQDDPFNTSNVSDPFSVPPDVTNILGGDQSKDSFSFESVKDSVPFSDTAAFEAFAAKFEQAIEKLDDNVSAPCLQDDIFDPFGDGSVGGTMPVGDGFGTGMDIFDPFKATATPAPTENVTPRAMTKLQAKKAAAKLLKSDSQDSFDDDDDDDDFKVVIRPKMREASDGATLGSALEPPKLLPPPPKSPARSTSPPQTANRFNPFNRDFGFGTTQEPCVTEETPLAPAAETPEKLNLGDREPPPALGEAGAVKRTDSQESPSTPLFDEDTSQPLEDFLAKFSNDGWEMMLRQPSKKKITGNRYWKKVYIRLSENSVLQLYNKHEDNEPFQELPLQACYSLSEVGAQQYDNYGKIFTVKLHYIFYRERVGVRPGQIHKVMQGQFTSVGQIAKLGLPLEHAPQVSQLLKIGTQTYPEIKTFIQVMEDTLFHLAVHRDRALTYKTEEIQVTVQDELLVDQRRDGHINKQKARVRLFFLAFMTGMPDVEVGLNDLLREGKEVVGRYDIIPVVTEEWIRLENCEFHCCVVQDEFTRTRSLKLLPPDACLFELMRFRIRPPRNRELPLQVKASMRVNDNRVELRGDVLVPGYHSRKHGQVPCEDIQIRFPIPECWIYLFRVEKHFRYGSLKSAARKPGKIKGLERIMGTAQSLDPSLIEVSTGQAKYEHAFKAVVWRIARLPKEGQGAYTTQLLLIKLDLTSFDQIPDSFEKYVHVEFTMPATTVSHTTVRSISVSNENPPEKYVKYTARHEYRVEIDMGTGPAPPLEYEAVVATSNSSAAQQPTKAPSIAERSNHSDDFDSD